MSNYVNLQDMEDMLDIPIDYKAYNVIVYNDEGLTIEEYPMYFANSEEIDIWILDTKHDYHPLDVAVVINPA